MFANLDNIDRRYRPVWVIGLSNNQMDADPIVEDVVDGDLFQVEDDVEEVESDVIYVGRVFDDENEAYGSYKSYALAKSFGVRKHKTTKSRLDQKKWGEFVYNKEGHKMSDKRLEEHGVLISQATRCICPVK